MEHLRHKFSIFELQDPVLGIEVTVVGESVQQEIESEIYSHCLGLQFARIFSFT